MADEAGELVARIARGDRGALRALVEELGPVCLGLATRVTANRELAEEALQEAFLDVWLTANRYDPRRGKARQWVLSLVHHKAVDAVRRERAAARVVDRPCLPSQDEDPEEQGWIRDRRERVLKALGALSPAQREAITLAYFDGLTYREVARRLGIPEGTAKSRLRDGLMALRGLLELHGVEWASS